MHLAAQDHRFHLDAVDISQDDGLRARYDLHIPVVGRLDTGQEIRWPFALEDISNLLKG